MKKLRVTYEIYPNHNINRYSLHFSSYRVLNSLSSASTMDWQGQKLAEQLMQIVLVLFAIGAFITGYIMGSFQLMLFIYAGGVVLTTLITIPNWPFFNRHSLKWLDPSEVEKHPKPQVTGLIAKKKPTKK
ncbi:hypothetical protein LXL04_025764 [Taraxacum kok-saghyz]